MFKSTFPKVQPKAHRMSQTLISTFTKESQKMESRIKGKILQAIKQGELPNAVAESIEAPTQAPQVEATAQAKAPAQAPQVEAKAPAQEKFARFKRSPRKLVIEKRPMKLQLLDEIAKLELLIGKSLDQLHDDKAGCQSRMNAVIDATLDIVSIIRSHSGSLEKIIACASKIGNSLLVTVRAEDVRLSRVLGVPSMGVIDDFKAISKKDIEDACDQIRNQIAGLTVSVDFAIEVNKSIYMLVCQLKVQIQDLADLFQMMEDTGKAMEDQFKLVGKKLARRLGK